MWPSGSLAGPLVNRNFRIGATVVANQIVCADNANFIGEVGAPASVNDYTEAVGITQEAGTYAATGQVMVKTTYGPFILFRGKTSGGTAADTAFTTAQILTESTGASQTTVSDTNVSTLDYHQGYLIPLSGTSGNVGVARIITTQTDNTSTAVTVQLPSANTAGDTYLRTYGPFVQGVELTTNFVQFNNLLAATEEIAAGSPGGNSIVVDVYLDDQSLGYGSVTVRNSTAPLVDFECVFSDSAFNSVA